MIESLIDDIRETALKLHAERKPWHLHVLSPTCRFNERDQYAFVVEDSTAHVDYVCYSPDPYLDLAKEWTGLLHGEDLVSGETENSDPMTPDAIALIARADELTKRSVRWHHHVLFPMCMFNKQKPSWTLLLEDGEELFESFSDAEPKNALAHLEPLFYSQGAMD